MASVIRIENTKQVSQKLNDIRLSGADLSPLFRQIIDAFYKIQRNIVFRSGATGHGKYTDLKAATKRQKIRSNGQVYPILVLSGTLRDSFKEGAKGNITKISKTKAEAGTTIPYATFHQEGTSRMPKRPVILEDVFSPRKRLGAQINGILNAFLEKVVK